MPFRTCSWRSGSTRLVLLAIVPILLTVSSAAAQPSGRVWFARAGGNGDGTSASNPMGSTADLEAAAGPGDVIVLLLAETPLDGGLRLKAGQAVIGVGAADRRPVITNSGTTRHDGNGIVLADDSRVWNVRVENTQASGIFGHRVSGVVIDAVEIDGANQSRASVGHLPIRALGGPVGHGGIVFVNDEPRDSAENRVLRSEVRNATGVGIAAMGLAAARNHLVVSDTRVRGGAPAGRADAGIGGVAEGPGSEVHLRIDTSTVSGRMSRLGRNVVVLASAGARASASIQRSTIGESGQDGVIAIAALIPASVALVIRDSVVENAAQTNVEGTILNLPASDPTRAHDATVSIEIVGSTIRGAGAVAGFETDPIGIGNIWLGSSAVMQQADPNLPQPFAPGSYRLLVRNSRIERARGFGVGAGGWRPGLAAETGTFDLSIRESSVFANGTAEITIAAPNVRVDARQNCWGAEGGLPPDRIHRRATAARAQVDTSEPAPCTASGTTGGAPR